MNFTFFHASAVHKSPPKPMLYCPLMTSDKSDQAFMATGSKERWPEMTYGGALSFLRRRYDREASGPRCHCQRRTITIVATTNRPGCRLGPRAIRAASVQLAELKAFPFGFDLAEHLSVADFGDCFINPHRPETVATMIEAHAEKIIQKNAKMLTFGGDHFVSLPLIRAHAKKYGPVALFAI